MLEITLRERTDRIPIEAECLTPDRLASLSIAQIAKLLVFVGNQQVELGELCQLRGEPADEELRLVGDWSTVKLVGAGMQSGRIVIDGDVGMHLGAEMAGGEIVVEGNAGDWAGAHMRGGLLRIKGNARDMLGAAYRGNTTGMRGGIILVHGNAGDETAAGMRRGLVAIGGDCGQFAGFSMTAGSLFVFGKVGRRFGAGMKRGTIVLFDLQVPQRLPTFTYDCVYEPTFLPLFLSRLRSWGFPLPSDLHDRALFERYNGDLLELGRGEILIRQPA